MDQITARVNNLTVVMTDPGKTTDPSATVGIEYRDKIIRPILAKRFTDTSFNDVAKYLKMIHLRYFPDIIGVEKNNDGEKLISLMRNRYNIPTLGVLNTSRCVPKQLMNHDLMDKVHTVRWMKKKYRDGQMKFPSRPSEDMQELINEFHDMVMVRLPSGFITYRARRSRHDDMFLGFTLCCNYVKQLEMFV